MALFEDIHVSFLMGQNQRQLICLRIASWNVTSNDTEEKPQDCQYHTYIHSETASSEKETDKGMLKIFGRYRLDQVTKKIYCPYIVIHAS
ncbi:unnamed protein product [Brassica oleracea var. botrytis]